MSKFPLLIKSLDLIFKFYHVKYSTHIYYLNNLLFYIVAVC